MCVGEPSFGQVAWFYEGSSHSQTFVVRKVEDFPPEMRSITIPAAWLKVDEPEAAPESCEFRCAGCRAGDHQCYIAVTVRCCCTECKPF